MDTVTLLNYLTVTANYMWTSGDSDFDQALDFLIEDGQVPPFNNPTLSQAFRIIVLTYREFYRVEARNGWVLIGKLLQAAGELLS